MRFKALASLLALPLTAVVLTPVHAAPQILGLMASAAPVPMRCVGGTCTAELSSVCLQEHRPTPSTGTVYLPAKSTRIYVTVTAPNGLKRQQQIESELSFRSLRQFTAVKVSLPEATVRRLGNGKVHISVAPMASLIPVAVPGDPNPLTADEIARYTGPLRQAAEYAFKNDSDRVNATLILSQMINRMAPRSQAGIEKVGTLWQQTVGKNVTAGTRKFLKRAVAICRESLRTGVQSTLRFCLGYQHDYLSGENTTNGWQAMKPGS